MQSLVGDLVDYRKKWIEIENDRGERVFPSCGYDEPAQEAAAYLLQDWEWSRLKAEKIAHDVDEAIYYLGRWRDAMVHRIETHPEEF